MARTTVCLVSARRPFLLNPTPRARQGGRRREGPVQTFYSPFVSPAAWNHPRIQALPVSSYVVNHSSGTNRDRPAH